jgi:hypothetical protein
MIKRDLGPFPTSHQLNRWADKVPGSRASVTEVTGRVSDQIRSIALTTTPTIMRRRQRKTGLSQITSHRVRPLNTWR